MNLGISLGLTRVGGQASGPALGPDLVANGGFDDTSDWVGSATVGSGVVLFSAQNQLIRQFIAIEQGKTYQIGFDKLTGAPMIVYLGTTSSSNPDHAASDTSAAGSKTVELIASTQGFVMFLSSSADSLSLDNVTVREVL